MVQYLASYLIQRFFYRLKEFFRHWYVNSFWIVARRTINFLEGLDRSLALKITLRNFWRPLYQDYTVVGYILGIFFRFWRIAIAALVYFIVALGALVLYLAWAILPFYIIYRAFR